MAWRIYDSVIRGEIDNRMKGRVRGRLWLAGLDEPVKLDLEGNACADLAGCFLKFKNPAKTFPMPRKPQFNPLQRGQIGNLSASQKVRVFTIPDEEAFAMIDRGEKPPERLGGGNFWPHPARRPRPAQRDENVGNQARRARRRRFCRTA